MCDTVCVLDGDRALFAKNSDRPVGEPQVVEWLPRRTGGGTIRTQYLDLPDTGAAALMGSRPSWLWGLEHGVNEHRVAIGNERVWTIDDPLTGPPALIGMDLVRLGLERAETAEAAVDVMIELLERHGQGGPAERPSGEPYSSSFLVADPLGAWVLETSGRTWAAKAVEGPGAAISNRISLGGDWSRSSADVASGRSFDDWRDRAWSPIADARLACTLPAVVGDGAVRTPEGLVALMRHHGERPWGRPGGAPGDVSPVPAPELGRAGEGISVCMHVRDLQVTAASMVCELPVDPAAPARAWVALGSPCSSLYLPVFPDDAGPAAVGDVATWGRFDALRRRAEADPTALATVRAELAPLERELWAEAAAVRRHRAGRAAFSSEAWSRVDEALGRLGV